MARTTSGDSAGDAGEDDDVARRPHDADEVAQILDEWRHVRPDVDPKPMGIFGRIARVHQMQRTGLTELLAGHDLTTASFDVLANLRRSGPPYRKTASDLAASSMISSGGVTFRLDRLEADGLIRRIRSRDDRRVVYAELTPAGVKLIDRVIEDHLLRGHGLIGDLDDHEQDELARLLAVLERTLRTRDGTHPPT